MRFLDRVVFWWDKQRRRTYRPGDIVQIEGEQHMITERTRTIESSMLDTIFIRLREVRKMNVVLLSFGIVQGFLLGFIIGLAIGQFL